MDCVLELCHCTLSHVGYILCIDYSLYRVSFYAVVIEPFCPVFVRRVRLCLGLFIFCIGMPNYPPTFVEKTSSCCFLCCFYTDQWALFKRAHSWDLLCSICLPVSLTATHCFNFCHFAHQWFQGFDFGPKYHF